VVRTLFDDCLKRIQASGIRRFDSKEEVDILYNELKGIADSTFLNLTDNYLRSETHPRNIVGWFKGRASEVYQTKHQKYDNSVNPYSQYTRENVKWFFKCVYTATELNQKKIIKYGDWVGWFNDRWMEKTGDDLDIFLKDHHAKLCEKL